jgi:hypothetical protein
LWSGALPNLVANDALLSSPTAALAAGDTWMDVEHRPQDGDLIAASTFGVVVRVHGADTVTLIAPAKWGFAAGVDVEHLTTSGSTFLYLLDYAGGLHPVPVAADGQTLASFPALYPYPYYGGVFWGKYVGLQALELR